MQAKRSESEFDKKLRIRLDPDLYPDQRYHMGKLPLHGLYLWRPVLSTGPPFILWWWKFEILFNPLPRSSAFLGGMGAEKQFKWDTVCS
jgi:hypothetical protein